MDLYATQGLMQKRRGAFDAGVNLRIYGNKSVLLLYFKHRPARGLIPLFHVKKMP